MKSTGVVRRIDELGRIVIPKEIRKNFRIKEGENLEIFINDNETISLKKYSILDKFSELSNIIVQTISQILNKDVIITDMNNIISYSNKNIFSEKTLNSSFFQLLDNRKKIIQNKKTKLCITNVELNVAYIIVPLITNGDLIGSICLISNNTIDKIDDTIITLSGKILTNYIEQ